MINQRIVILGGYGTFGSLVAEQLSHTNPQVVIAGRDTTRGSQFAASLNAKFVQCDTRDPASVQRAISQAHLVINAAGPFQAKDYAIPQACIEQGCHYIDLSDGREYVASISQLHEKAKANSVFVCVGASTTPAITSAAVAALRPSFAKRVSISIALSAGNKNPAGVSTIASILAHVGAPLQVWHDNEWQARVGWSMGEFAEFPAPVGRRRVQLCNVPDLELFPRLFEADSVSFRAGVELTLFNYAIAGLAHLRKLSPTVNLSPLAVPLVRLSSLAKALGTLHGSCSVWLRDRDGNQKGIAFVAPWNGPRIPSAPAVLLARKLLTEGIPTAGAFSCVSFISLAEFEAYLAPFGIYVVDGENGAWQSPDSRRTPLA